MSILFTKTPNKNELVPEPATTTRIGTKTRTETEVRIPGAIFYVLIPKMLLK